MRRRRQAGAAIDRKCASPQTTPADVEVSTDDKQPMPCTGNHGNVLTCGSDRIDGIRVSPGSHRRQENGDYFSGSDTSLLLAR